MPRRFSSSFPLVARETYGSSVSLNKLYGFREGTDQLHIRKPTSCEWSPTLFKDIFLPQGYPGSVSKDYIRYQIWDSIQAFCSSLTGTLSTRAILTGVGVGDETATAASATATWLLKDGTGMLGRILFAWLRGTQLDCNAKCWRLFADILNDFALGLDIVSPYTGAAFTPILCVSGILKSIVGVSGGATRAALTQHQARRNNLADVSAKDGSQETLVNLAALVCSLVILPFVQGIWLTWTMFILLTFGHILSNYLAVTSVEMETFNTARLKAVVKQYVLEDKIPSIREANQLESVWLSPLPEKISIRIGKSLEELTDSKRTFKHLRSVYRNCNYLINLIRLSRNRFKIVVVLHQVSDEQTQLAAMFEAVILCACLSTKISFSHDFQAEKIRELCFQDPISALNLTRELAANCFGDFVRRCKSEGWKTSPVLFGADDWRFKWQNEV